MSRILNNPKEEAGSAGSSTSLGIFQGGHAETWDGTNWTETANLNTHKIFLL